MQSQLKESKDIGMGSELLEIMPDKKDRMKYSICDSATVTNLTCTVPNKNVYSM